MQRLALLGTGMTLAIFIPVGKTPVEILVLHKCKIMGPRMSKLSLKIRIGNSSKPGEVFLTSAITLDNS